MSEERTPYQATAGDTVIWATLRFADNAHTGVRVLRGTTVIEIQSRGRKQLFDIAECKPIDQTIKSVYTR